MSAQIHFEIFVRRKGGGWSLQEALTDRSKARFEAKRLLGSDGIIEVRVVKETMDNDGTFQSVTVFEAGEKEVKKKKKPTADSPGIPCFKPQDLHGPHARATIGRVLSSFLQEWGITPMELIHSADLLEKLEARSATMRGAVQKIAVAMAADSDYSVQDIYSQLMDLCLRAMDRVVQDERKGRLQAIPKAGLAALVAKLPAGADLEYLVSVALAKHLRPHDNKPFAKLEALIAFLDDLPTDDSQKTIVCGVIDAYVSELLRTPNCFAIAIGKNAEPGDQLRLLANLFLKRPSDLPPEPKSLTNFALALKSDQLPASMMALSTIILSEIKSNKRMHPSCFTREIETIRHLAQQLVYGVGTYLSIENLTEAFLIRSRRLVTQDAIGAYLEDVRSPIERISKLIELEENIVGEHNKRSLAGFILPITQSVQLEGLILDEKVQITQRLQQICTLQRAAQSSQLDRDNKNEIVQQLGRLAERAEDRAQLFRAVELKRAPSADKALSVMRLREAGVIPDGACWSAARNLVRKLMRKPDFAQSLCPDAMTPDQHSERRSEFKRLFDSLDIPGKKESESAAADAA